MLPMDIWHRHLVTPPLHNRVGKSTAHTSCQNFMGNSQQRPQWADGLTTVIFRHNSRKGHSGIFQHQSRARAMHLHFSTRTEGKAARVRISACIIYVFCVGGNSGIEAYIDGLIEGASELASDLGLLGCLQGTALALTTCHSPVGYQ